MEDGPRSRNYCTDLIIVLLISLSRDYREPNIFSMDVYAGFHLLIL